MSLQNASGPPNLLFSDGHDGAAGKCVNSMHVSWMKRKKG